MNFHLLMPFYRKFLINTLMDHLEPMGLIWYPICDHIDIEPFEDINEKWIKPALTPKLKIGQETAYKKVNDCIDRIDVMDSDYYGFIGDDDMYCPGFIDKIKQQTAKILIFSCSRGEITPNDSCMYKWPPVDLTITTLGDIRIANIDFCQMIVKGEILRQMRFGERDVCDDGHYAEGLKNQWPDDIIILPEIGVNKNYFQPGRYTIPRNYTLRSK